MDYSAGEWDHGWSHQSHRDCCSETLDGVDVHYHGGLGHYSRRPAVSRRKPRRRAVGRVGDATTVLDGRFRPPRPEVAQLERHPALLALVGLAFHESAQTVQGVATDGTDAMGAKGPLGHRGGLGMTARKVAPTGRRAFAC